MRLKTPAFRGEAHRLDEMLGEGKAARVDAVHDARLGALVAVARQVEGLRPAAAPLPADAIRSARQVFLARAARMRSLNLSSSTAKRPVGWFARLWSTPRREAARLHPRPSTKLRASQGRRAFASGVAAAVLILLLILTTGITLGSVGKAAQTSLPGDRYYVYKITQEDLGAALTFDPASRVTLYVKLVKQRSEELFNLVQAGRPAPAETAARLRQHLIAAFLAASQLPDLQMESALLQIRQVSLSTQNTLEQVELDAEDDQSRITLDLATYAAINASILAEKGLADPQEFRALMSALPPQPSATPSSAPMIISPPFNPTTVSVMPTATVESFNPPASSPTPSKTNTPAVPTPVPPTATNTPYSPPTTPPPPPATPTATNIAVGSTPIGATATAMPTPTATRTPGLPFTATPTPISQGGSSQP